MKTPPLMNIRMLSAVWAVLALTAMSAPANADLALKDYRAAKAAGSKRWEDAKLYITGVGTGFGYSNVELVIKNEPVFFCQPENFRLLTQNYIDILDKTLAKLNLRDEDSVEVVLLVGLEEAFPCDPKR